MNAPEPIPFTSDWPDPAPRFLRLELPPAPTLPLRDALGPNLAQWVEDAAQAKGAPLDYVFAALLAVVGATIGNTRWVSPWRGWEEPPIIWSMCIGLPSAGKSPAMDAVLQPLRHAERSRREAAEAERQVWRGRAELAKLAEAMWKEEAKAAIKAGDPPPEKPREADAGPPPHIPRLVVNDGTIERLGAILAQQPRGTLQTRDELAGWLEGMQRYSGGGSDRPFWLEAYGGRGFTVERMGREALTIDRLTIGVLGGIQPDRLKSLLFKSDDDGLLARFLPIWPDPVPLRRPQIWEDEGLIDRIFARLLAFDLVSDDDGETSPFFILFDEDARELMDDFRHSVREWEAEAEGLLLSFIGKLPGLTARLALVLAFLDHAAGEAKEPGEITAWEFGRAAHLVESYFFPMARRAYADASTPKSDLAARRLVSIIREQGWRSFTARDVMRLDRAGLARKADLDPALAALEDGDCIRLVSTPAKPQGGRRRRLYAVNPALHKRQS
ncbi:YfjI family protein [Celeribacter sp. PS-C1]|uniref:YfjI family protein n=1 Tax=Celeribacter sp. PS-C1 TaxID=2820813 RepID=UPI001C6655AD|nr:YfjI family protein [Celeribacter sp. PS-C1]MBW6419566.1 DUF3987 domain-containing protein [Celeribacter sp. PS-C1]